MRNLKRALSLVLASVMVLGLMIVGSSAKSDQFSDVADINEDYTEAIDVLTTIGVLEGVGDGSYDPQGTLTREMAAKILSVMLLGEENADRLGNNTQIFKDVAAGRWSAGYIAYCANTDPVIIAGDGTGNFDPDGKLTGVAFGKMLLTALGYDAEIEGYVNTPSWAINVASDMVEARIDVKGITFSDPITREQAAQMALNAIQTPIVEYEGRTQVNVNGAEIIVGGDQAKPVLTTVADENTISSDRVSNTDTSYTVEFGERFIKDLKKTPTQDEFMRPAHVWSWKNEEIDTYVNWDMRVAEYTYAVSGKTVYDALTGTTIENNNFRSYLDGTTGNVSKNDLVRSNTADLANTGNGVLTQIFLDSGSKMITMTSINTWLAQATGDYNESKEYAPLKVFNGIDEHIASYNVDVERVPEVVDVVDEAYYLVNISYKDLPVTGEVVVIQSPEIMADKVVTKFSRNKYGKAVDKLTTDGTEYKASMMAYYDADELDDYNLSLLTDMTYNIYMDQYGYAIGVDLYKGDPHYVFITGYDRPESNLSVQTADAAAIFLDGTMEPIKVNVSGTNNNIESWNAVTPANPKYYENWKGGGEYNLNRWYSYSINESGIYTLKPVTMVARNYASTDRLEINTSNVQVAAGNMGFTDNTRVYGEDESIFITVDLDEVDTTDGEKLAITDVNGVYTGVQDVDLEIEEHGTIPEMYAVYDKNYYIIGAVVLGDASGSTANFAYVIDKAKSEEKIGEIYYWEFDVIIGGELETLTAKSKYPDIIDNLKPKQVQELRFDSDGYVVKVVDVKNDTAANSNATGDKVYNYSDATYSASDIDITKYDVYDVATTGTSYLTDTAYHLTLHQQGRTLYVTGSQDDKGLALASNAKAVTIQPENNKTNIKTEFSSVAAAITHLADPVPDTSALEYSGRIVAVLDKTGAAEWVVFISNTPLTTGTQQGYGSVSGNVPTDNDSNGASANVTRINLSDRGILNYTIEYKAPDWVGTNGTTNVTGATVHIYVNGYEVDSKSVPTIDLNSNGVGYISGSAMVWLAENANEISFSITDESYKAVKVKYVDKNYKELANSTFKSKDSEVEIGSGKRVKFVLNTTSSTLIDVNAYQSKQADIKTSGRVLRGLVNTVAANKYTGLDLKNAVMEDGYVVIFFDGLSSLIEQYAIKLDSSLDKIDNDGIELGSLGDVPEDDADKKLTLKVDGGSFGALYEDGSKISIKAKLADSSINSDVYGYKVNVTIGDETYSTILNGTTDEHEIEVNGDKDIILHEDYTLASADISVETIDKIAILEDSNGNLQVTERKAGQNYQYVINFNRSLEDANIDKSKITVGTKFKVLNAEIVDNQLIITVTGKLTTADDKSIKIEASEVEKIKDVECENAMESSELTLKYDSGKWTLGA